MRKAHWRREERRAHAAQIANPQTPARRPVDESNFLPVITDAAADKGDSLRMSGHQEVVRAKRTGSTEVREKKGTQDQAVHGRDADRMSG